MIRSVHFLALAAVLLNSAFTFAAPRPPRPVSGRDLIETLDGRFQGYVLRGRNRGVDCSMVLVKLRGPRSGAVVQIKVPGRPTVRVPIDPVDRAWAVTRPDRDASRTLFGIGRVVSARFAEEVELVTIEDESSFSMTLRSRDGATATCTYRE